MTSPIDLKDARWSRLREAEAMGEELSADDRRFLAEHEASSVEVKAEQELLGALAGLGADDGEDAEVDPLVDAVVTRHRPAIVAAEVGTGAEAPGPSGGWRGRAVVLAAAAAAIALAFALWPRDAETPTREDVAVAPDPGATERASETATPAPSPDPEVDVLTADGELTLYAGVVRTEDGRDVARGPVPKDVELTVADAEACMRVGGSEACFDPGSTVRVGADDRTVWVEPLSGRARIDAAAPDDVAGSTAKVFVVQVAGARYQATEAAKVVVELEGRHSVSVTVSDGALRARDDAAGLPIGPPLRGVLGKAARPSVEVPAATELLSRARKARAAGDRAGAIAAYESLVEHHAKAPAARPALVTLAQLYLEAGQPRRALKVLDRYLATKGPLAEEASYGRIQALGAMGRAADERAAIRAFLAAYPESSYAGALLKRLGP